MMKSHHPPSSQNRILSAALNYSARGWLVLPLHTLDDDHHCSCGRGDCTSVGKHPRTAHGARDATLDEAVIRGWWKTWPHANLGVATGTASGFIALDVDPSHGGDESLAQLQRRLGPLPVTVEARTGGGGQHLLFAHPGSGTLIRNAVALRRMHGIDLRGDGGYIVAAPSLHTSGNHYAWKVGAGPRDVVLAPIPSWLLRLIMVQRTGKGQWIAGAVDNCIPEGQRNSSLASLAGSMQRRGMCPEAILAALLVENGRKCCPPLPYTEVARIVRSIGRYKQPSRPKER